MAFSPLFKPCSLAALLLVMACGGDGPRGGGVPDASSEDAGGLWDASPPPDDGSTPPGDGGVPGDGSAEPDSGSDGGAEPPRFGNLTVDTRAADQTLDLFGKSGHRVWFEVSQEQLSRMNERRGGGLPGPWLFKEATRPLLVPAYSAEPGFDALPDPGVGFPIDPGPIDPGPIDPGGDIYTPGDLEEEPTFADHVVVQDAVSGSVADYGRLEVALVGESTFRAWSRRQIPNLRLDVDEFQEKLRIGGFEHFRFNNGLVGSIFREHLAHRVFRALGYPALRTSFAFIGSNVWGPDVWVPMTLVEMYKRRFCKDNQELLGGTCENMWEFPGDAGNGELPWNACQVGSCDNTRMQQLAETLADTPLGPGFKAALDAIIDWPRYHAYQCIGWILATGDDAVRATNNNLIIERSEDHRLIWAPYSVDISAGQDWHPDATLLGQSSLARGCQSDPACWADTYAVCEQLVADFDGLDPEKLVDETAALLTAQGMMRSGDEARAAQLRAWYEARPAFLASVLPRFRVLPDQAGTCPDDLLACEDGGCGTAEECESRRCAQGQLWCESTGYCMGRLEECPSCTEETPLFCPAAQSCVQDADTCSEQCASVFGEGYAYCPAINACELAAYCVEAPVEPYLK